MGVRGIGAVMVAWAVAGSVQAGSARAQAPPSQAELDDLVQLGSLAALAPLCGMREESWAFDLRRAAMQSATRPAGYEDPALKAAPGSDLAVSALSYAEAEALESFAEAPAAQTCGPLERNPDLARADRMVREFRAQRGQMPGS